MDLGVILQFGGWARGLFLTVKTACYRSCTGPRMGFCKNENEPSAYIKGEKFLN